MWIADCTAEERLILTAIATLVSELPRSLYEYADAIGDLNSKFFGVSGASRSTRDHNPSGRSLSMTRKIRATR